MNSKYRHILLVAFVLAAGVRLAAIPMGLERADNFEGSFFDEYGGIAENLNQGEGFAYAWFGELRKTSIHAPLYPYLLATVFRASEDESTRILAVLLLNTGFSLILLYLSYLIARRLMGPSTALIVVILLAFYPTQIYYSVSGIPTALYAAMLLWVLWETLQTQDEPTPGNGLRLGVALGLCALSYSFIVVLAPLLAVWALWRMPRARRREGVVACALAVVVAACICTPWTLRNHRVHGHWILIRDQGGTNLWWGNGPYATGGPVDRLGHRLGSFPQEIEARLRSIPNEVEGDRFLGDEAKNYMRAHPGRTARLWAHKARLFWWFDNRGNLATGSAVQRAFPVLAALKALLLVAAAWGLFLFRRDPGLIGLVLLVCLAIGGVHTAFHAGRMRYFFPLEPLLCILAAGAVWSQLRRHPRLQGLQ